MGLNRTVAPASYPVTLEEAKAQCRVTSSDEDTKLNNLIAAATTRVENMTGLSLITQTWELTLDEFSDAIELPRGPVQSVTSVQYVDPDGATQVLAASVYTLDDKSNPQWIVRNADSSWPQILDGINAVTITYVAGEASLPEGKNDLKHAILLLVSYWYDERMGEGEPMAVKALLEPFMSQWVAS